MKPRTLAPYFVLVALVHLAAVASRFDVVAAQLPEGAARAILLAQVPLLVLSGFFEGKLDYGPNPVGLPGWMQIRSTPVKLAFTFGFIYLACVALQTWDISIGPIDPTPPESFPVAQRAAWFATFTVGMFFPFYLAAAKLLIPVLRALTWPLRALPSLLGAILALAVGGALGVGVFAAVASTALRTFVAGIKESIARDPAIAIGVTLGCVLVPMALGLALDRARGDGAR